MLPLALMIFGFSISSGLSERFSFGASATGASAFFEDFFGVFGFASRHGARQRVNHDGGGPLVTKLEFDLRNERFGLGDEVDRHQDQPEGYGWHLVAEDRVMR